MKKIVLFKNDEINIIERCLLVLKKDGRSDDIKNIINNRVSLGELASSISLYPSILQEQHLGSAIRTIETLVESLCQDDELDLRFHLPTKALLGNGFLIAKINFFFMLYYIASEINKLSALKNSIKSVISGIVFMLMAEEVFLSILDDKIISKSVRMKAGYLIANIWEYRLDHGVKEFAPILSSIWEARETLTPVYGSMLGLSELFKISNKADSAFLDFLQRDELCDEEISAMEEFIFGLSYEETEKLRKEKQKRGLKVVRREDVEKILGHKMVYPEYVITDPRELYKSFRDRKIHSKYRSIQKTKGPHKTIEEYLMIYLLSVSEIDFNNNTGS